MTDTIGGVVAAAGGGGEAAVTADACSDVATAAADACGDVATAAVDGGGSCGVAAAKGGVGGGAPDREARWRTHGGLSADEVTPAMHADPRFFLWLMDIGTLHGSGAAPGAAPAPSDGGGGWTLCPDGGVLGCDDTPRKCCMARAWSLRLLSLRAFAMRASAFSFSFNLPRPEPRPPIRAGLCSIRFGFVMRSAGGW